MALGKCRWALWQICFVNGIGLVPQAVLKIGGTWLCIRYATIASFAFTISSTIADFSSLFPADPAKNKV